MIYLFSVNWMETRILPINQVVPSEAICVRKSWTFSSDPGLAERKAARRRRGSSPRSWMFGGRDCGIYAVGNLLTGIVARK